MWRIFKNNENSKDETRKPNKVEETQTKTIITKTGTKEVSVNSELDSVNSKSDSVLFDYDTSSEIIEKVEIKDSEKSVSSDKNSLEERIRVIDSIMEKAVEIPDSNIEPVVVKEDLTKFDVIKEGAKILDSSEEMLKEQLPEESVESEVSERFNPEDKTVQGEELGKAVVEGNNELDIKEQQKIEQDVEEIILEVKEPVQNVVNGDESIMYNLFSNLRSDFESAFMAGLMYRKQDMEIVYNFNFQDHQIELESNFYLHLLDALQQSNFNTLSDYYVLDLKDNQIVLVLTLNLHHIVLVFDKREIKMGYLLSIIKPQVIEEYYKYVN